MKRLMVILGILGLAGCATITNDENVPVALSFSDGSSGSCMASNKRINIKVAVPGTSMIRRSDDSLTLNCTTEDGRTAGAAVPSVMGAKIVASAVFLDFGLVDSITDKHRHYPASFVIPVKKK